MTFLKHTFIYTTDRIKHLYTEENQFYVLSRRHADVTIYLCIGKKCKARVAVSGTECYSHSSEKHNHDTNNQSKFKHWSEKAQKIRIIKKFIVENPKMDQNCTKNARAMHEYVEKAVNIKTSRKEKKVLNTLRRDVMGGDKKKLAGLLYTIERVEIIPKEKIEINETLKPKSKRLHVRELICTK